MCDDCDLLGPLTLIELARLAAHLISASERLIDHLPELLTAGLDTAELGRQRVELIELAYSCLAFVVGHDPAFALAHPDLDRRPPASLN